MDRTCRGPPPESLRARSSLLPLSSSGNIPPALRRWGENGSREGESRCPFFPGWSEIKERNQEEMKLFILRGINSMGTGDLSVHTVSIDNMEDPKIEARLAADESLNGRADRAEDIAVRRQDHSSGTRRVWQPQDCIPSSLLLIQYQKRPVDVWLVPLGIWEATDQKNRRRRSDRMCWQTNQNSPKNPCNTSVFLGSCWCPDH